MEEECAISLGPTEHSLRPASRGSWWKLLPAGTYSVDDDCAEDGCGDRFAILGILSRAHDGVVARGEHGADGAEDYDGEDGDDDAAWWRDYQCVVFVAPALAYVPGVLFLGLIATYHVHALKAETTGFMVAGCAALSGVGMGSRGLAWAERRSPVVRGGVVDAMEVLLRRIGLVGVCWMSAVLKRGRDASERARRN